MRYHWKTLACLVSLFLFSVLNAVHTILKFVFDVLSEDDFVYNDRKIFLEAAVDPKVVAGIAEFGTLKLDSSKLPPNFSEVGLVLS